MKDQKYHKELGATVACKIWAVEGIIQVKEAWTVLMGDAWFGSVRAAAAAWKRNMDVVYQIKTNYGLFPKQFIEEKLKDASSGMHIVLEGKHPEGANLVVIGYRYNLKVTLYFVITKNTGSIRKGKPYEMKFMDSHSNVHVRLVDKLSIISEFF